MYETELEEEAEDDVERLDKMTASRITDKIEWLGRNFDSIKPKTLKSQWARFFKLRVGDYRIIYKVMRARKNESRFTACDTGARYTISAAWGVGLSDE